MVQLGVRVTKVECKEPHSTDANKRDPSYPNICIPELLGPDAACGRLMALRLPLIWFLVAVAGSQRGSTEDHYEYKYTNYWYCKYVAPLLPTAVGVMSISALIRVSIGVVVIGVRGVRLEIDWELSIRTKIMYYSSWYWSILHPYNASSAYTLGNDESFQDNLL